MSGFGNRDIYGLRFSIATSGGYQFYTTSPVPQWAIDHNSDSDFYPGGSGIYVPYPKVVMREGVLDISKAMIKALPTGSTVEEPLFIDNKALWNYWSMPPDLSGLNEIMSGALLKVKDSWQVNGFPESVYFSKILTQEEMNVGLIRQTKNSLFHAYVQGGGQVHGCGAFQPISYIYFTDFRYDVAPAKMKPGTTQLNGKVPDTDWFGKACLCSVVSEQFGTRLFIIASSYNGVWYCYPVNAEQDRRWYEAQYAVYGEQAYKASVISDQAKSYTPAYPNWVTAFVSWRDLYWADAEKKIFEPCYSWSFSQNGKNAISVMVERKASESTCAKINYQPSGLATAYHQMRQSLTSDVNGLPEGWEWHPLSSPYLPTEVEIENLQVDPSARANGTSDSKEIQIDRRGCIELEFTIEITGTDLKDFTFYVGVSKNYFPDALEALGMGTLVEVAYAMPLNWAIEDSQSLGKSITNQSYRTSDVAVDDVLSVWTELYRHKDQSGLIDAYDGEITLNVPSKAKARFYKGYLYDLTELFCLPLSQAHGAGYTHSDDPETVPESPHLFVRNTDRSFSSMFPWEPEEGESAELYYYRTRITSLDLKSLSFYCTVRLLEQRRGELEEGGHWCAINNRAKQYCAVCVMGKIIDEYEVGNPALPVSWLRGWLFSAGAANLDEWEFLIPVDYTHHLRGIGFQARNEGLHNINGVNVPLSAYNGNTPSISTASWVNQRSYVTSSESSNVGTPAIEEGPCSPWWATGPCGHILAHALKKSLAKAINDGDETVTVFDDWGSGQGQYTTETQSSTIQLDLIESNFPAFLEHVYDLWSSESYQLEILTSGDDPENPGNIIWNHYDYGVHNQLQQWYSENPFTFANPEMSKEQFIASLNNSWGYKFIHDIVQAYIHEIDVREPGEVSPAYCIPYYVKRNMFVIPRGGGVIVGTDGKPGPNYNSFTEFLGSDYVKLFTHNYSVKNLELGNIYYNSAIMNHFTSHEIEFTNNISVTPEGHISYYKKNLFEIKKEFCTQKVWYENYYLDPQIYVNEAISTVTSPKKTPKFYRIENITNEISLSTTDIDWKSVDGVSWYYNHVKTKHLYLYNLAYQTSTGDERKKFLQSNEEFLETYTEEMFKPDFLVSVDSGFRWIYPYEFEDGQPVTLDRLSCPIGDRPHFTAVSSYPTHDPRLKKTFLRLSPLFF